MIRAIPEVVLAGDPIRPTKDRTITLYKSELIQDVNQLTYKYGAKNIPTPNERAEVQSDTQDPVDGTIIVRFMKYRDSKLRRFMRHALTEETREKADDVMVISEDYVYNLEVYEEYRDSVHEALAELMHKYIIWGTLADWYMHLGERQIASDLLSQIDEIESEITDILRSPSIVKRPMAPFGPRRKGGDFI